MFPETPGVEPRETEEETKVLPEDSKIGESAHSFTATKKTIMEKPDKRKKTFFRAPLKIALFLCRHPKKPYSV
jgi:hypothetical protein